MFIYQQREISNISKYKLYGNVFFTFIPVQCTHLDLFEIQRQREARRKALARKRAKEQVQLTPEPVEGREHVHVQTGKRTDFVFRSNF